MKTLSHRPPAYRRILDAWKARPCQGCGVSYPPCVMPAHHRDPSTKHPLLSVRSQVRADAARTLGLQRSGRQRGIWALPTHLLEPELEKCDALCGNCHALRHEAERVARRARA